MPSKRFAVIGPAAAALAAACFFGSCEEGGGESHDSRLVGDWQAVYEGDGAWIEITTLTASGDMFDGGFLKAGDFWIEGWEKIGTWRTSNGTLYEEYGDGYTDAARYAISGNKVILAYCDKNACDTAISEKVDVAAVRNRLGTVRGQDAALFTSTAYADLIWYLEGGEDEIFDFDMMYFWGGERYFGGDMFDDQVWCTDGSRLFLIGMDIDGEVENIVELDYSITGGGSAARLSVRPIIDGGGLGPEDVWLPVKYESRGRDGRLYKSKPGKKYVKSRKGAFAPPRPNKS